MKFQGKQRTRLRTTEKTFGEPTMKSVFLQPGTYFRIVDRNDRRIAKSLGTQASSLREGCGMESPPCAG